MIRRIVTVLAVGLLSSTAASGASFSTMTVFGDSLSDTGNVFIATGGTVPIAPYFNGRFSNGPVWIDVLAGQLGLPDGATPAFAGGDNYAFGGARTGVAGATPGLLAQSGGLWGPANPLADPTGLYVLVGGGNDMRDARSAFSGNTAADDAGRQAAAEAAMANLISNVQFLASRGAQHLLVASLPDLGATPEAAALGLQAASSDVSARFNALMPSLLDSGTALGLSMYFLDMAGLAADVRDDALNNGGAVFGILNVLTPCGGFPGSIGISCNISLFSDALHPSARAHELLGLAAFDALMASSVPEPATWVMLVFGLLLLARRRKAKVPVFGSRASLRFVGM